MELIEQAKTDDQAFEELFQKYLPVVYRIRQRYYVRDFDLDDWLQEARWALFRSLNSYEEDQGTTFGLYYKMIFENQIRSVLRKQKAQKRQGMNQAISIEKTGVDVFAEYFYYHNYAEEQVIMCEQLENDDLCLSKLEKATLYHYLNGADIYEIGDKLSEKAKTVSNALCRAKKKIREELSPN